MEQYFISNMKLIIEDNIDNLVPMNIYDIQKEIETHKTLLNKFFPEVSINNDLLLKEIKEHFGDHVKDLKNNNVKVKKNKF